MVVVQGDQQHSPGSPTMFLMNKGQTLGPGSPFTSQPLHAANTCGSPVLLVDGGMRQGGEIQLDTMQRGSTKAQVVHGSQFFVEAQTLPRGPILQGDGHIQREPRRGSSSGRVCVGGPMPAQRVMLDQGPTGTGQVSTGQKGLQQLEVFPQAGVQGVEAEYGVCCYKLIPGVNTQQGPKRTSKH